MLRASIKASPKIFGHRQSCVSTVTRTLQFNGTNVIIRKTIRNYSDQEKPSVKNEPLTKSLSSSILSPKFSPEQDIKLTKTQNEQASSQKDSNSLDPSLIISSTLPESTIKDPTANLARKPRKALRKLLLYTLSLGVYGFIAGVFYSRKNDNFNDFFTEYVPFGEQAVLYLEEREYRKKYSDSLGSVSRDLEKLSSIPRNSGVSWRVAEGQKPGSTGRYADATDPDMNALRSSAEDQTKKAELSNKEVSSESPVKTTSYVEPVPSEPKEISKSHSSASFTAPEVDEPSRFPPQITSTHSIRIDGNKEPLVQDLVEIINDILTAVETNSADAKLSNIVEKAKSQVSIVSSRIQDLKDQAQKEADSKIQSEKEDFDRAAKELLRRMELEMQTEQATWREEYQTEREKMQRIYEKRLDLELQRAKELHEQRLRSALLEQALELKKQFSQEIKDRVEEERNGRLKKLSELSDSVAELEKLATNCNSIVDHNLSTQKLHIALEATRVFLEKSEAPRPFVRELVALREIASEDPVVNAAIASINPNAYHHGIPSSAQIIDRFRRVGTEVRKAALLPIDAGVASQASSYVLSKFLFKKKGLAEGDDVESILSRAETFLEEGDLDSAAREVNGLQGWAKTLSRDWLDEVRMVLEVRQALDVIATEARLKTLTTE